MQDPERAFDLNFALLAAGAAAVIVYGSLFPFHFHNSHGSAGSVQSLVDTWRIPPGRGDFLANVLLYLPYGLFSAASLRRLPALPRVLLVTLGGLALAVILELGQFYVPGRVSSVADVYADTVGSMVGAAAGWILFRGPRWLPVPRLGRRPFVILLLSFWLGFRVFPFVPTIDLHKYWTAVRPLIFSPSLPPLDLYRHTVLWLAVALLLEAIVGIARSRLAILLLAFMVLLARVFVIDTALSPAEVGGAALAFAAWGAVLSRLRVRTQIVAALFVGMVVIEALEPFRFSSAIHPFGWIPFLGFLRGSTEVNARSLLEKAFTYGSLIWLIARAGCELAIAASLSAGLVLCLRLSQVFLPGRSAEITDVTMVLIFAAVMKLMGEHPARPPAGREDLAERAGATKTSSWHSFLRRWYESLTCHDPVQPVDMIFVVAGRMERKRYGLELFRAGQSHRLVLSVGRFEVSKISDLDPAASDALIRLRERTSPDERHFFVQMDATGTQIEKVRLRRWSTYGEALALRRFLENTNIRKVMVVSTDIHLRRVALTYANVFRGVPVDLCYCSIPARFGFPEREGWWARPGDRRFVMQETLKLAGYWMILSGPRWATPWLMRLKRR